MRSDAFGKLNSFLDRLEEEKICYTLARHRDEAIMVLVTVPGERWEVEFFGDGSVEVERFTSNGEIRGEEALTELWSKHSQQGSDHPELLQPVELAPATG